MYGERDVMACHMDLIFIEHCITMIARLSWRRDGREGWLGSSSSDKVTKFQFVFK